MAQFFRKSNSSKPSKLKTWWKERRSKPRENESVQGLDEPLSVSSSGVLLIDDKRSGTVVSDRTNGGHVEPKDGAAMGFFKALGKSATDAHRARDSPPQNAKIFTVPHDVLLYIADFLDYPSIVMTKLTCKQLNNTIPVPRLAPTVEDKLAALRLLPASMYTFPGERSPPHLCNECVMWHSFEHLVIYPDPNPESVFASYQSFTDPSLPRVCARFRRLSAWWVPGQPIDFHDHILCVACNTPRNLRSGRCSWNCRRCMGCTRRKGWSSICEKCWKLTDGLEMMYMGYVDSSRWHSARRAGNRVYMPSLPVPVSPPAAVGRRNHPGEPQGGICGRCLGMLTYVPGSREMCRCGEDGHNFS